MSTTERWISRADALNKLGYTEDDRLRNYELEDALSSRFGGVWIVAGKCPYNGVYTASKGLDTPSPEKR